MHSALLFDLFGHIAHMLAIAIPQMARIRLLSSIVSVGWRQRRPSHFQSQVGAIDVVIRFPSYFRRLIEILGKWRRIGGPFQPRAGPRVPSSYAPIAHGPNQVDHWEQIT